MKLGKVIGNVVASVKDPGLEGLRLLIVQGLDDNFQSIGEPYVAADGILTAGPGDIVYVVSKKEAAFAIPGELVPIDECIVGYVEEYHVIEEARKKKAPPEPEPEVTPPKPEPEVTPPEPEPEVPPPVEEIPRAKPRSRKTPRAKQPSNAPKKPVSNNNTSKPKNEG